MNIHKGRWYYVLPLLIFLMGMILMFWISVRLAMKLSDVTENQLSFEGIERVYLEPEKTYYFFIETNFRPTECNLLNSQSYEVTNGQDTVLIIVNGNNSASVTITVPSVNTEVNDYTLLFSVTVDRFGSYEIMTQYEGSATAPGMYYTDMDFVLVGFIVFGIIGVYCMTVILTAVSMIIIYKKRRKQEWKQFLKMFSPHLL